MDKGEGKGKGKTKNLGKDIGKPGVAPGEPTYVWSEAHRSGYKVHITGLPSAAVVTLSEPLIRHWLATSVADVPLEMRRGFTAETMLISLEDVHYTHTAASGGGRCLRSLIRDL